jgi:molybdate-binding protein
MNIGIIGSGEVEVAKLHIELWANNLRHGLALVARTRGGGSRLLWSTNYGQARHLSHREQELSHPPDGPSQHPSG